MGDEAPLCEEYLAEYLLRGSEDDEGEDAEARLARRERDLLLAAELGKALLEKNEQISIANERLAEEYSRRLEVLEQEKHSLRRRLESLGGEYESRVSELQQELAQLREELEGQRTTHRRREAERTRLLEELTDHNHRLTAELKQAAKSEDSLEGQLRSLREQFNVRRSNLQDHVTQLEGLREEITLLSERKQELERRIAALSDEREGLSASLEESGDRIAALQRNAADLQRKLRSQQQDIEELRQANGQLQLKLQAAERGGGAEKPPSLLHEISLHSSVDETTPQEEEEDEIECDDECLLSPWRLGEELLPVYRQLRRLCEELRERRRCGSEEEEADSGIASEEGEERQPLEPGALSALVAELERLLDDEHPVCRSLAEERGALERVERELADRGDKLRRRAEEARRLAAKVTLQEAELRALQECRDQLRSDLESGALAKDQVVRRAWEVRDQAVARKNAVEIELARTRIDVMHVNSQLMEAVQQKIELSQQLEQWKMDMEVLLDSQVMKKLKTQEQEDKRQKEERLKADQQEKTVAPVTQAAQVTRGSKLFRLWR